MMTIQLKLVHHLEKDSKGRVQYSADRTPSLLMVKVPHSAHSGQTPYEALKDKLQSRRKCPAGQSWL